ncbi:MAG: T9SS type A sorting domain-containing protein [Ignavibacteriales bacterium]|nr:T9SS type A sorting domain-containing protein [Ignavibacteriales bacterium]
MKNLRFTLSLITLFLISAHAQQKHVIGYYPGWYGVTFPASALKYNYLTHINHAFAFPDAEGNLKINAAYKIPDAALVSAAHTANVKVSLSLGGASESGNFPGVVADSLKRSKFISDIIDFLYSNNYDGVDLDWEGPANVTQKNNLTKFVIELDSALFKQDPDWLITMAVGATNWSGQWHDYAVLKQHIDWFNIMTYDFHGSWSHCGHNSPLYSPSGSSCLDGSIKASINYHNLTRGIPKNQLVVGMPFYGYRFECTAGQYGLYKPITKAEQLTYIDILSRLLHGTRVWDDVTKNPYITFTPPVLISYDDSLSISLKCQFSKENDLAGVMIWALGQDALSLSNQPLMEAVGTVMFADPNSISRYDQSIPQEYSLSNNFPNPFNPTTTIHFSIPSGIAVTRAHVRLTIYDLLGREVASLVDEEKAPGNYSVQWNADSFSSGTYLCRLESEHGVQTKAMILLK